MDSSIISKILSSEMNGTTRHYVLECVKSPRKSAGGAIKFLHRRARSLDWIKGFGEAVSTSVGEGLNRAFDGKDAVEFVNSAVAMVPKISPPSMRTVSHTVDSLTDRLQKLNMRKPTIIEMPDKEFQGCQWIFASDMGHKAENALVKQHICERQDVMEGRRSPGWQMELTQALANTYIRFRKTYTLKQLLSMKPVWIPVRGEELEVWRLVLETDWVDVDPDHEVKAVAEDFSNTHQLETDFAMPAMQGWMSVKDYCRDTWAVEGGEWEVVEA
ncbi:hypothetical protein BDV96DRAFT_606522 [Lophiotrema nucula]|uniref:Uncharacterized protein n=1 Tax=Lophiotrema nucula TaxID=690887 RepID=A0A6A5YMG9_9PLEO|nr:hypothetical protein BDV96DRAFT_606522 [Lophiotrema nucula]